jgi:hypothetical protein
MNAAGTDTRTRGDAHPNETVATVMVATVGFLRICQACDTIMRGGD